MAYIAATLNPEILKNFPGPVRVGKKKSGSGRVAGTRQGLVSRQSPLDALTGCAQTPQGTLVPLHVLLVLALKLIDKVVNHNTVNVFATQVSVTRSGLDLIDALLDG